MNIFKDTWGPNGIPRSSHAHDIGCNREERRLTETNLDPPSLGATNKSPLHIVPHTHKTLIHTHFRQLQSTNSWVVVFGMLQRKSLAISLKWESILCWLFSDLYSRCIYCQPRLLLISKCKRKYWCGRMKVSAAQVFNPMGVLLLVQVWHLRLLFL